MPIQTKRWNDKTTKDDGYRLLVCRSKPRGVPKEKEKWDGWCSSLSPSPALESELHAAAGSALPWEDYQRRYLEEMKPQDEIIDELARMTIEGKTITLLCSKTCKDETHCHRSLLKSLIEKRMELIKRIKN